MDVKDWITIGVASLVVVGWFVNSFLNRRHEITKKRMEFRLEALSSFIPVFLALAESKGNESELVKKLSDARVKFQLYCSNEEIDWFERLVKALEKQDNAEYNKALGELIRLVREGIRGELGLEKYQYPGVPQ